MPTRYVSSKYARGCTEGCSAFTSVRWRCDTRANRNGPRGSPCRTPAEEGMGVVLVGLWLVRALRGEAVEEDEEQRCGDEHDRDGDA